MNQTTPFNPILIPNLNLPTGEPAATPAKPKPVRRKATPCPKIHRTSRNGTTRRALDPKKSAIRFARKVSRKARRLTQQIKGGITSRLAHLDQAKLKKVLIACGVAAAVAAAICILVKLTPLIITLLALLGLGAVLQMWERLRVTRIPA
jgi:hypothetical protein